MNTGFWRLLLILGLAIAGFLLGATAGGLWLVPANAGLAGGPMVLGYGALGAVALAVPGLALSFRLDPVRLRKLALIVTLPVLAGAAILIAMALRTNGPPDADYTPAGRFSASMQRLDASDPYLFTRIEVDSRTRQWTQTGPAPDHAILYAPIRPQILIEIRQALDVLAARDAAELATCAATGGPAIKRLRWKMTDTGAAPASGSLDLAQACIDADAAIARALFLLEKASGEPMGKVRRK